MKKLLGTVLFICALFSAAAIRAQDQNTKDEKILKDYFAKNHIKATRTPSGLYYVITKKGTGENAKPGIPVSMNYMGKFLDGRIFDANIDEKYQSIPGKAPFSFILGTGQVIPGWDEGVQLLNKGSRATFYLPSALGYGAQAIGPIPPNSVLVFDVEVVSIGN
jgi:FKBP-type peptidyl-prolyl cis-trans isomerase